VLYGSFIEGDGHAVGELGSAGDLNAVVIGFEVGAGITACFESLFMFERAGLDAVVTASFDEQ
jgi:hypothetical protein